MKKQTTVPNPISVKPSDVAELKQYFPNLTDYEAIKLLQNEQLLEKLDDFRVDYRKANVITDPDVNPAIPALEKIAIILQDIRDQHI